ncbi:MAG: hypothetical protein O9249_00190 [Burkholderiaceae bacterium]|nr:hypothetical protein [Burkholderiaceae bacterium]
MHLEWPIFRWIRLALEPGVGFTLLVAFFYIVATRDFRAAASVLVSVLATYIAVAALFFNRGRALPRGPSKVRSLYIAERATQAIAFTLVGLLVGVVIFAWGTYFESALKVSASSSQPWLLIFFFPLMLVLWGYISFVHSLRVIAREFLHPLSVRDIARRIKNAP